MSLAREYLEPGKTLLDIMADMRDRESLLERLEDFNRRVKQGETILWEEAEPLLDELARLVPEAFERRGYA